MINLVNTLFDVKCELLVCGENSDENNYVDQTVTTTDCDRTTLSYSIAGNPLELEEIVNLSLESNLIVDPSKRRISASNIIDLSRLYPIKRRPVDGYQENVIYYINFAREQIFGVFPSGKATRRILRINVIPDPDMLLSISDIQRKHMLLFPDHCVEFEAKYCFKDALFDVKFRTTDQALLSPPLSFVIGKMYTELDLYNGNGIPTILDDIKLLKIIFDAYETDASSWNSRCDQDLEGFRFGLSHVFKVENNQPDESFGLRLRTVTPLDVIASRQLDSTECIWNALKNVNSRQNLRNFVSVATAYLLENRELLKLHRTNDTQLAMRLRSIMGQPGQFDPEGATSFPFGVECLLEVGLYKVTNDCICLLESVIPDVSAIAPEQNSAWNLDTRWSRLHRFYKASCFFVSWSSQCSKVALLPELRKMLSEPSPKNEWRMALTGNPAMLFRHEFSVAVSDLVVPITSVSPSLWIMRMDADEPLRAQVRVVYERVSSEGTDKYVCHELRLVDTFWPGGS